MKKMKLFLVASVTLGGAVLVLVAPFAELVADVLELGCFGLHPVAGAAGGGVTAVVAGFAIGHLGLMHLVGESDVPVLVLDLDIGGAFGGEGDQGSGGKKRHGEQYGQDSFHRNTS
jgi:hypothetical protein